MLVWSLRWSPYRVAAPAFGQTKSSPPNPSAPSATETAPAQPGDAFGEDAALTAKTIVYVKGSGSWDKAFEIITGSFKKVKSYLDKEGIKPDGLPMTIFTATDDTGSNIRPPCQFPTRQKIRRAVTWP